MDQKYLIAGAFFLVIIASGLWLSHIGKPYHILILTAHKLISLAGGVYLAVTMFRVNQVSPLGPAAIAAGAVTLILFIAMLATGGILSAAKTVPAAVHKIHQFAPYLAILSTAAALYFVQLHRQ